MNNTGILQRSTRNDGLNQTEKTFDFELKRVDGPAYEFYCQLTQDMDSFKIEPNGLEDDKTYCVYCDPNKFEEVEIDEDDLPEYSDDSHTICILHQNTTIGIISIDDFGVIRSIMFYAFECYDHLYLTKMDSLRDKYVGWKFNISDIIEE